MRDLGLGLDQSSASGLRPAAAFVCIVAVLIAVAGKSAWIALAQEGEQPERWRVVDESPVDEFTLVDRAGRTLALSVECFDVSVSPRSMWRAHTPDRIARELGKILGEDPEDVLERLLPGGALARGVYRVEEPRLLSLDEREAGRVLRWIRSGATEEHGGAGPIDGLELVALEDGTYTLCFAPATLLSSHVRAQQVPEAAERPSRWTRRLLNDLAILIDLEPHTSHPALAELPELDLRHAAVRRAVCDALWSELVPSQHRIVARRVDPLQARAISELMQRESISPYQLRLEATRDRRHPLRPGAAASFSATGLPHGDAFSLLGSWGVVPAGQSREVAQRKLASLSIESTGKAGEDRLLDQLQHDLETRWRPWSGIERAAHRLLDRPDWQGLVKVAPRQYMQRVRSVPRDRHEPWRSLDPEHRLDIPDYYLGDRGAGTAPVVVTTLDAGLQQALHERLLGVMEEHDPALAMGIVVEVASGAVLAADGINAYDVSGFAPLTHAFTPGSTFKAVIMANALDAGVVRPDETFPTFAGSQFWVRDGRSARAIGEAEGAPTEAFITATDGLAESVNAVLVQIGLRMDSYDLHDRLLALGYDQSPASEMGPASAGMIPGVERRPWTRAYTHASVCFGHEVLVTLWQHAASLATIARGGEYLPLRVIERVAHEGHAWEPAPAPARRVLSEKACAETRAMLAQGALRGTGEPVAGPDHCPEFEYIGTKTGTTERQASEFCLHVEWPHAVEHARIAAEDPEDPRARCSKACKEKLRYAVGHRPGRGSCYTLSMMAIGRLPGDPREVLVMVVVEDSRSKARYGSGVAGKATIDLLRRAFDLGPLESGSNGVEAPGDGDLPPISAVEPFPLASALNHSDLPWLDSAPGAERLSDDADWNAAPGEELSHVR